jgi:SET domain-containing protein
MRQDAARRRPEPVAFPSASPGAAVEVRRHPAKGRGLFATREIAAGTLIEAAPAVVFPAADCALVDRTRVAHYYFHWDGDPEAGGSGALALGLLSLCNHAARPLARVHRNFADETLELVAIATIPAGAEITIDYGCALWFDPAQ